MITNGPRDNAALLNLLQPPLLLFLRALFDCCIQVRCPDDIEPEAPKRVMQQVLEFSKQVYRPFRPYCRSPSRSKIASASTIRPSSFRAIWSAFPR